MILRSRRVRLKRLRRMNGFAPRLLWVRAGFPAPSLLLHPFQRNRILNEEIAAVSIQISKIERARSIQRVFEQLYLHQKGRVRSPSAPPPAEILSQYRLVYNTPPEFVRDDDELVEVAFELLTTRTRRDEGGDFPPLPDFRFTVEGIREALRILGRRKCAGGVSGATYEGMREAFQKEPNLARDLHSELESLRGRLLNRTNFETFDLPKIKVNLWPNAARRVKLTLIPKTDPPDPKDVRKWRPVSNAEPPLKVPMESLRQNILKTYVQPLPPSLLVDRSKRWFSRFCSPGVVAEGLAPGGGPDYLTRYLQFRVNDARRRGRGLTVLFLDLRNGFGSVPHERILPSLIAMGLDRSAAAFLAYVFINGIAVMGGEIFDVAVGIFQGLASSPFVFILFLTLVLTATGPEEQGGLAVTLIDDITVYFEGSDSRSSRHASQVWVWKATRLFKAFGLTLNVEKSVVLSLEGRDGRTRVPSPRNWASQRVGPRGAPFPCLGKGSEDWLRENFRYLGRFVRIGSSDLLRRSGIFDTETRGGQGSFSEALAQKVAEVKKATVGQPFLVTLQRLNEALPQILYGRLDTPAPSKGELKAMNAALRRQVRSLGRFPGHLGNAVPTSALHRPRRHWGFGLISIEQTAVLTGVRNAAKALSMPTKEGSPFNPVRLLLLDPFIRYLEAYEVQTGFDPWEEHLVDLKLYPGPYPAVECDGFPEVVPVELLDGAAISRKRLAANQAVSQFPSLLSALMAVEGKVLPPAQREGVPAGRIEFSGKAAGVCHTVTTVVAKARVNLKERIRQRQAQPNTLVQNAIRGWTCVGAKYLQRPSGLRLQELALLGPISGAKWRLRRGPYVFKQGKSTAGKVSAVTPACNACGATGAVTFTSHVLGGSLSSGKGCPATRELIMKRHAALAKHVGITAAEGRIGKGEVPKVQLEVPKDSDLHVGVQGKDQARADAVTLLPLEAVVSEVSVTLSPIIARQKVGQLRGYITALSAASGIPKTGWPVHVLWRKVGLGAMLGRLQKREGAMTLAYAIGEPRRYFSRCSATWGRQPTPEWLERAVKDLLYEARRAEVSRVVVIATPKEEALFRRVWLKLTPTPDLAVVPPRPGLQHLKPKDRAASGYGATRAAAEDAGLGWPKFCPVHPPRPGPLRVVGCLGVFDPLGTAYPITCRSYLSLIGRQKIQDLGAGVLGCMPFFVREWKAATARKRKSKQLCRVSKARRQ